MVRGVRELETAAHDVAHGPDASHVCLKVRIRDDATTVGSNTDRLEPEILPRLFDRFFRADSSRNCPDAQHHGLGLAIVAAIARMHAGQPLAESAAGTTRVGFTLAAR